MDRVCDATMVGVMTRSQVPLLRQAAHTPKPPIPSAKTTDGLQSPRTAAPYFLPAVLLLAFVFIIPLGYTIWLSFQETSYFTTVGPAGIENFRRLVQDPRFYTNLANTLTYAAGALIIALPAGLGAALLLQRLTRGVVFARSLLLLPWLMSQATVGVIWIWFLNPNFGPASFAAREAGLGPLAVFASPGLAMMSLILITAWWSYPQAMVFFLGALQMVPNDLYDSVKVDGGGTLVTFRHVIWPFVRNTAVTGAIVLVMLYMQMVTIILVTTGGGPLATTETMSMRVYNELFRDFDLAAAATSALVLFLVNVIFTAVFLRLRQREY